MCARTHTGSNTFSECVRARAQVRNAHVVVLHACNNDLLDSCGKGREIHSFPPRQTALDGQEQVPRHKSGHVVMREPHNADFAGRFCREISAITRTWLAGSISYVGLMTVTNGGLSWAQHALM